MKCCFIFRAGYLCFWLSISLISASHAAGFARNDTLQTGQDTTRADSLRIKSSIPFISARDTLKRNVQTHKKPWLAVGLSAIIPGAGQIYNQNYWKPPIVWGFGGYWVYEWIQMNSQYKDYKNQYSQSIVQIPPSGNQQLLQLRDFYRDERDKFAWYLGALYFLNLIDAYVSASLFDFDVSSDLGMGGTALPGVKATLRWKL